MNASFTADASYTAPADGGFHQAAVSLVAQFSPSAAQIAPIPEMRVDGTQEAAIEQVYSVAENAEAVWSNNQERAFSQLTAKKSLGKISAEELHQWRTLQAKRRKLKNPLPAKEVLFQYRRRQLEAQLMASFTKYVSYVQAPRS